MNSQLAISQPSQGAIMPVSEFIQLGKVFYQCGFFKDLQNEAQAIVKIMAGRELGVDPFAAVDGIHIIQGKPSVGAGLMAQRVKESVKYDYRILKHDANICEIEYFEITAQGKESLGVSTFTAEDARKAGTQNMAKFPKNMLFARAMSNGVGFYCPDVFSTRVYTPEEMGAVVDGDGVPVPPTSEETKVEEPAKPAFDWEAHYARVRAYNKGAEEYGLKQLSEKVRPTILEVNETLLQQAIAEATPVEKPTIASVNREKIAASKQDTEGIEVFDVEPDGVEREPVVVEMPEKKAPSNGRLMAEIKAKGLPMTAEYRDERIAACNAILARDSLNIQINSFTDLKPSVSAHLAKAVANNDLKWGAVEGEVVE